MEKYIRLINKATGEVREIRNIHRRSVKTMFEILSYDYRAYKDWKGTDLEFSMEDDVFFESHDIVLEKWLNNEKDRKYGSNVFKSLGLEIAILEVNIYKVQEGLNSCLEDLNSLEKQINALNTRIGGLR